VSALQDKLARARLVVLDVDGVLTDGRVIYAADADGETLELQRFDAKDGLGLNLLKEAGIVRAWITGRGNPTTERRAGELGIEELHMRARTSKADTLREIQERLGIAPEETVVMGDDLIDLPMRERAAVLACPADAHGLLLERADFVSRHDGGRGAVRDLCDAILIAQGCWDALIERFAGTGEPND